MSATILLADDSPTIQKVVELTFAETDYRVVAVSSGSELLDRLPELRPDVVICDVIMPDRDGYDVCQTIKSSPETLHIPVVLLTGTFEPFDRDRALAVGCDEIVTKPFEARQLIATVEKLVAGGGAAEEPAATVDEEEFGTYLVSPPPSGSGEEPAEAGDRPPVPQTSEPPAGAPEEPAGAAFESAPPTGPETEGEIPEEGLDFTTSGFAEMEAAGQQPHVAMEPPAEGIEVEEEAPIEIPVPERNEEGGMPSDAEPGDAAPEAPPFDEGRPPEEPSSAPSPSDTAPVEAEAPSGWEFGAAPPAPPEEPEETVAPEEEAQPEPVFGEPAPPEPPDREPPVEPVSEPPSGPATEPAAAPVAPAAAGHALSDEDIDRIARRVVELFADRLEQIAWEVLPDMAEIIVRERVREIEAEIEEA